ncbi:MAG: tetratricopeptide repeat protein [Gemmataceae bacterium]
MLQFSAGFRADDTSKAIELDPKFVSAWHNRGWIYNALRQYEKAVADFSKAIELNPKNAGAWHSRGWAYETLRQYDKAVADFSKAIELNPKNALTWANRGWIYYLLRQYDKAVADISIAIGLNPKYVLVWNNRGQIYNALRQYDKAVADFSKAIELNPKNGSAWINRAKIYETLRQYDKAVADLAEALKLYPNSPHLQNYLAWLLATGSETEVRDPRRALELASAGVKTHPNHASLWTTLGVARYLAGDWQGSAEALQNALKLFQGSSGLQWGVGRSLLFLAMAQQQLGHPQEARQTYDRAVAWLEANRKAMQEESPASADQMRRFQTEASELLNQQSRKVSDQESRAKEKPGRPNRPSER